MIPGKKKTDFSWKYYSTNPGSIEDEMSDTTQSPMRQLDNPLWFLSALPIYTREISTFRQLRLRKMDRRLRLRRSPHAYFKLEVGSDSYNAVNLAALGGITVITQ